MTYDQWKTRDPNEPFAEHEEDKMPMPSEPSQLKPCPFCGNELYRSPAAHNPKAYCVTEDCYGKRMSVVNLDDPIILAMWNTRALPAPQGEPVVYRYMTATGRWSFLDQSWQPTDPHIYDNLEPLYAAPVPPADLAEDCAKIAEGHVGMYRDEPKAAGYDEASHDIAKAIRDTHGVDVDAATGTADDQDFR